MIYTPVGVGKDSVYSTKQNGVELVVNYLYSESCNGFERLKPFQKLKPFNDEYWGAYQAIGFASPLACPLNCPFGFADQQYIEERGVYFYGTIINQNSIEQADSKVVIVLQEREPFVRLKFLIVILLGAWASILAGVWFASCPNTNQIKTNSTTSEQIINGVN